MKITVNLTAEATRTEIDAVASALAENFPGAEIVMEATGSVQTVTADDDATAESAEQVVDAVMENM